MQGINCQATGLLSQKFRQHGTCRGLPIAAPTFRLLAFHQSLYRSTHFGFTTLDRVPLLVRAASDSYCLLCCLNWAVTPVTTIFLN
jgi:hypothetical protein